MSLNSLLNNAMLIKTAIQPMNHNIPVVLERKKMYLQAVAKYSFYPIEDQESNLDKFMTSHDPFASVIGLQYGEAVLAVQPIPFELNGDDLIQAFDKLSESIAEYTNTHRMIFAKAQNGGYIAFHNIQVHEPDFELRCNGHILERNNITNFFMQVGVKQHLLKTQVLRSDINTQPNIYYIKIDKDEEQLVIKTTFKPIENKDEHEYVVQNIELVKVQDNRDEVLKSVPQFVIDDLNQNLECAVDEFSGFIRIINTRNNIQFVDTDLPF